MITAIQKICTEADLSSFLHLITYFLAPSLLLSSGVFNFRHRGIQYYMMTCYYKDYITHLCEPLRAAIMASVIPMWSACSKSYVFRHFKAFDTFRYWFAFMACFSSTETGEITHQIKSQGNKDSHIHTNTCNIWNKASYTRAFIIKSFQN